MTLPNTPASTPVQECPDCKKPTHGEVGEHCIIRGGDRCIRAERDRLRQELDSLPEHFSLSVFADAGLPLAQASLALMVARRVLEDAETERAKGGG